MTLTIGKRFQFPVSKRHKLSDVNLRRLISYGCYFIVFDVEKVIVNGKIEEGQDKIFIMQDLGDETEWKFRRHEIEDILDESRP